MYDYFKLPRINKEKMKSSSKSLNKKESSMPNLNS
jgi:hypothetical protein